MMWIGNNSSRPGQELAHFVLICIISSAWSYPNEQANYTYWYNAAHQTLDVKLKQIMQKYPAKNVIFFLGDGMGPVPATAGRIYVGQKQKKSSEQDPLSWETFPYAGLQKTYDMNSHVTDSASSATAFLQGTKSKIWTLGVQPNVDDEDCQAGLKYPNPGTIASWAMEQGKWAGLITTTRVTHATPGGTFAHSASREWECDAELPPNSPCIDIARQLVEFAPGKDFRVIMGGGREKLTPTTWRDPEPNYNLAPHPTYGPLFDKEEGTEPEARPDGVQYGQRKDGRNLIDTWLQGPGERKYVWNRTAFEAIDIQNTDYLMGLFEHSHIDYKLVQDYQNRTDDPTLDQMTAKGIQLLQKNPKGFFLLVEGGRIDQALHINNAHQSLEELLWFDKSVAVARAMTDIEDTLIIVTADHSHSVSMVGYPSRNISILDAFSDGMTDKLDTSILVFANGPAAGQYHANGAVRRNLSMADTHGVYFEEPAFMPRNSETHGGEDVGIWASGPYSHLFTGTTDNTFTAHAMAFAMCVGPSRQLCLQAQAQTSTTQAPITPAVQQSSGVNNPLLVAVTILSVFSLCLLAALLFVSYRLLKVINLRSKVTQAESPVSYSTVAPLSATAWNENEKKSHAPSSGYRSRNSSASRTLAARDHPFLDQSDM